MMFFYAEDEGGRLLENICNFVMLDYTYHRWHDSSVGVATRPLPG
jgi:hypothetical protein